MGKCGICENEKPLIYSNEEKTEKICFDCFVWNNEFSPCCNGCGLSISYRTLYEIKGNPSKIYCCDCVKEKLAVEEN